MTVQTYKTVLEEVQFACTTLSILKPTGVYDSTDENALLMGAYANQVGEMLLTSPVKWQQFRGLFEIFGDGIQTKFDVPADYSTLINNTGWSHSWRRPCYLATPQQWAYIKAWVSQFTLRPVFRLVNNQFEFFTAPAAGERISFEYTKKGWVIDGDDPQVIKQTCNKNGDIPMFDWLLFSLGLKIKWREAKGFDTTADARDFGDRISQVQDADTPGEVLSLNGAGYGEPYLGPWNLPNTGYGG